MFEVKGATFGVNGKRLLHPVEHRFEEGKAYGLIGHNGSEKSTLIKLLAQQQPASQPGRDPARQPATARLGSA